MLYRLVVSPEIAERLKGMDTAEVTMIIARLAASKEVGILKASALKEAEEAIAAGKKQDVVVGENMEVMDASSYSGPCTAFRLVVHGSSQNPQINIKNDKKMKKAVGILAELVRGFLFPDVPEDQVAGYGFCDHGGFAQASKKKLAARREYLQLNWFRKLLHNLFG